MSENHTLPHLVEYEFCDKGGNTVRVYASGDVVTFDRNGRPMRHKKGHKPDGYVAPEDRMRDLETRMSGIEARVNRLENDGR